VIFIIYRTVFLQCFFYLMRSPNCDFFMKTPLLLIALFSLLWLAACTSLSEEEQQASPPSETEAIEAPSDGFVPQPADVATAGSLIDALYATISGPAGPRNWSRLRYLCKPKVHFNTLSRSQEGPPQYQSMELKEYIKNASPFFEKSGFFETEIGRHQDAFGDILQVFSAYQVQTEAEGPVVARGINSIQLVQDQGRWWIVNILWDTETPNHPIPLPYLKGDK
jgi:hypothetical protein